MRAIAWLYKIDERQKTQVFFIARVAFLDGMADAHQ